MVLKSSGNLEIFCGKVLIWASNTCDSRINGLYFKHDAYKSWLYLVAFGAPSSTIKWILHRIDGWTYLRISQNDENLVLYSLNKDWDNRGFEVALDTYGKRSNCKNHYSLYTIEQ